MKDTITEEDLLLDLTKTAKSVKAELYLRAITKDIGLRN